MDSPPSLLSLRKAKAYLYEYWSFRRPCGTMTRNGITVKDIEQPCMRSKAYAFILIQTI